MLNSTDTRNYAIKIDELIDTFEVLPVNVLIKTVIIFETAALVVYLQSDSICPFLRIQSNLFKVHDSEINKQMS